jgi:ketosteroid isomerase-like protein
MAASNKTIVKKVNAAFADNDPEVFLKNCKANVVWNMVGEETRTGVETIRNWMKSMGDMEPPKFTVDNLIGEGDIVVSNGNMTMKNKEGKNESYSYCDVYRFEGNKIAELTSYVVKTTDAAKPAKA